MAGPRGAASPLLVALAHWDLPPVKSVERIGGEDHVFKVRTDGPTMILKDLGVSPPDHRRLEIVQGVLDHVASRAVQVAIPVRSRSGRIVAQSEGRHFLVLEYIEAGESPDDPGLSGELYQQAGLAIAELHDASPAS